MQRELNLERSPPISSFTESLDAPSMKFNQPLRDRETKSQPTKAVRPWLTRMVSLLKRAKDAPQFLGRHANSRIRKMDPLRLGSRPGRANCTTPPCAVNFAAFFSKLMKTCTKRTSSA